jgi:hypothetical protein
VIQGVDNLVAHSKMNHVELHAHYLRQLVQEKVVTLVYYSIDGQITDNFTKPLFEANFIKIRTMLGFH